MSEQGEKVDGLIPKIQEKLDKYAGGSVQIVDKQNGGLNSTYEILRQLQKVYPELTDEARAYVSEAISGNRQNVVLTAIMDNWENVESAVESASNSMGSAEKSNAAYLDSIEGKTKKLASTTEMFWKNLIDSNWVKGSIDMINRLVTIFDKLINNSFSRGIIVTGLLTGAFVLLNKGIVMIGTSTIGTTVGVIALNVAQNGLLATTQLLTGAMMASPLFIPMLIAGGITAGIVLINKYGNTLKNLNKRIDETSSALSQLNSEYDGLKNREDLTDEQKIYLQLLEKEIERKKESLAVDKSIALQREFLNKETRSGGGYTVEMSSGTEKIDRSIKSLKDYKEQLKSIDTETEKGLKQWEDISRKIRETEDDLSSQLKTLMSGIKDIENSDVDIISPEELKKLNSTVETIKEILGVTDELVDSVENIPIYPNENNLKSLEELTEEFEKVTSKIKEYSGFLDELNSKEGLSAKSKQEMITKHQELLPYISDEQELRKQLIRIIEQEEKTQKQAYISMLMSSEDFFNAKIKGNSELVKSLNEYYGTDLRNFGSLAEAKGKIEIELINKLSGIWAKYYGVVKRGNTNAMVSLENQALQGSKEAQQVLDAHRQIAEMENHFRDIALDLGGIDFKGINLSGIKGSSSSNKDAYGAMADRYAQINLLLDKNNVLLAKNRTEQSLTGDDITKKIKLMEDEMTLYKDRQKLLNQLNIERRNRGKELQNQLQSDGFKFEGNWNDNSIMITNLEAIAGKGKAVEERYKEILSIMKELPSASQEWLDIQVKNKELAEKTKQEYKNELSERLANSKNWIEKRNFYDDWGADNEIAAWERVRTYIEQYYADGIINHKEYSDYILEIDRNLAAEHKRLHDEEMKLYDEKMRKYEEERSAWVSAKNAELQAQRDRLSALDSIQEAVVAIIRKRGDEEKKALDKAHNAEIKSLDDRHNKRKKMYKEELDEFNKMIQGKIDALDDQYEESDYLEALNKERESASKLQKEIDVLSLDDSLTARNKTIELRKQLADQNDKIAKMQQKKERDVLKKSLQDQMKDKQQDVKEKENIADEIYNNEKKRLEEEYAINKEFLERKYSDEKVYAEARESIMRGTVETSKGMFQDIYSAYQDFENKFGKGMGVLGDIIKRDFLDQLDKAQQAIRDLEYLERARDDYTNDDYQPRPPSRPEPSRPEPDRPSSGGSGSQGSHKHPAFSDWSDGSYARYVANKELWETGNAEQKKKAASDNRAIRFVNWGWERQNEDNYTLKQLRGYRDGGVMDETGMFMGHGSERSSEVVFSAKTAKKLWEYIENVPKMPSSFKAPQMPNISPSSGLGGDKYEIKFDVKGNMDKSILPQVEKMIISGINKAQEQKISKYKDVGIRRPV